MKIKLLYGLNIFFVMLLASNECLSSKYYCPTSPLKVKIGEALDNNWVVNLKKYTHSKEKIKQFKKQNKNYLIDWWAGIGFYQLSDNKYNIFCCGGTVPYEMALCSYKIITAYNCKLIMKKGIDDHFLCD